jgi:hypothetical protein
MITFDEAKSHLRVTHNDEDADITLKLKLAIAIVQDYVGDAPPFSNSRPWSEDIADAATLQVLGELYANREAGADPLSPTVRTILERLRVPGYA